MIKLIWEACCQNNLRKDQDTDMHLYPGFNFVHGITVLPENASADEYFAASQKMRKHFMSILSNSEFGYNVIAWESHVLMIPRR